MYDSEVFVFGSKIFEKPLRDAISSLPLELSWKIFSYLDMASLRNATHAFKVWKRIIVANKTLRSRLNHFELVFKLGSESMVKFYKRNIKRLKKSNDKNYLPVGQLTVESTTKTVTRPKRGGPDLITYTKRYKLF